LSVNALYVDGSTRRRWPSSEAWGLVLDAVNTESGAADGADAARVLAA
jgi:hypothetical protein